jgi:ribonuclease VapC
MTLAVDASALLAILLDEPDAEFYLSKILVATAALISPLNWWEVQVRMQSLYGEAGEKKAAEWMTGLNIVVEPVTLAHAQIAVEAFGRYRGRPARLNMGDCFAYALAQSRDIPLLYKGGDFSATDVSAF